MGVRTEQTFFQRENADGQRHMERCSTLLIIGEMQTQTTTWYHLTIVRMFIIKKNTNNSWQGCGEKETLLHCCWECKLVWPLWKTVWKFLKKLKLELPSVSSVQLLNCVRLFEPHGLQHSRLPCPPPTPGVCPNSCPLSQWCHPTISSSVIPFSSAFSLSQHQGLFQRTGYLHKYWSFSFSISPNEY